ncbi:MAG TPA: hypothetical protein VGM51_17650 [Armatimonadota bacterium]|jgi:hypothetical protein
MRRFAILAILCALSRTTAAWSQDAPPPPPPEVGDATVATPEAPPPGQAQDDNASLRAEVAALKAQVAALQARMDQMQAVAPAQPGAEVAPPPETATGSAPTGGGSALLLPDISFIGTAVGHLSTDKRDQDRSRIFLDSAEIGIQSYVYPGVKADAFITAGRPDFKMAVEEAYVTALNLGKGLSAQVGKRKVAFGRTNQLHPHSWLYITPPSVLRNLVADESLTGQGATLSYLLPTKGGLFAQLDAGLWNSPDPATIQPAATTDIRVGPGAAFQDRFKTLRLWTGRNVGANDELELGASAAYGNGQPFNLAADTIDHPQTTLAGADLSYRHYGKGTARTLLRGEYVWRRSKSDLNTDKAHGFYVLADQRVSPFREYGLRYDWSQYPFAPGLHEASASGILTHQLTERTYLRLQLTHGNRPGKDAYNEAWLQWVWGLGPHTHNLE